MSPAERSAQRPAGSLPWHALAASRRGSAHAPEVPNQDAVRIRALDGAWRGRGHVVAVADGHGGRRYVRSAVGAELAVEVATAVIADLVEAGPAGRHRRRDGDWLQAQVPELVERWRERVAAHHATRPFSAEERERAGADLDGHPVIAYGATLLLALVLDDEVLLAQLGDGDVLVVTQSGPRRPVPVDDRLVAGETTSLCLPDAANDFRYVRLLAGEACRLVVLATDGYGNSFADSDWWILIVEDFERLAIADGPDRLASLLPEWLGESARVGGDDTTVAVLLRSPSPAPLPPTALVPRTQNQPAEGKSR